MRAGGDGELSEQRGDLTFDGSLEIPSSRAIWALGYGASTRPNTWAWRRLTPKRRSRSAAAPEAPGNAGVSTRTGLLTRTPARASVLTARPRN